MSCTALTPRMGARAESGVLLDAVFQVPLGASFVVNGAAPPKNSALASAGTKLFITINWSVATKFDGEFAANSQIYAGADTLRYEQLTI